MTYSTFYSISTTQCSINVSFGIPERSLLEQVVLSCLRPTPSTEQLIIARQLVYNKFDRTQLKKV